MRINSLNLSASPIFRSNVDSSLNEKNRPVLKVVLSNSQVSSVI